MIRIKDVAQALELIAPLYYQESYDNAGLICGNPDNEVLGVIVAVDCTEEVIDDAISNGANLIVSHHPVIFRGLKKITGKNYVEKTIIKAIKNDISIYAVHTNLDNVLMQGTNEQLAQAIGLHDCMILKPDNSRTSIDIYISALLRPELLNKIARMQTILDNRFGLSYRETNEGMQLTCPKHMVNDVLRLARDYNFRYQWSDVQTDKSSIGSGLVGSLTLPMTEQDFMTMLKNQLRLTCIRHTDFLNRSVQKVAVCGGSGSFLLQDAIRQSADIYISGDFKYHEFFDADGKILIADIGHYESERFTMDLLKDILNEKFSKFATRFVEVNTNPINYFT